MYISHRILLNTLIENTRFRHGLEKSLEAEVMSRHVYMFDKYISHDMSKYDMMTCENRYDVVYTMSYFQDDMYTSAVVITSSWKYVMVSDP